MGVVWNSLLETRRRLRVLYEKSLGTVRPAGDHSESAMPGIGLGVCLWMGLGPRSCLADEVGSAVGPFAGARRDECPGQGFSGQGSGPGGAASFDPLFDVDVLAAGLKVSRRQLYRKLKALLAITPHDLITGRRLQAAAVLLRSGDFTVSEVAYKVGYTEPANFTRSFTRGVWDESVEIPGRGDVRGLPGMGRGALWAGDYNVAMRTARSHLISGQAIRSVLSFTSVVFVAIVKAGVGSRTRLLHIYHSSFRGTISVTSVMGGGVPCR